jgi:glycosyltransferase involved in cell wall biosynthesis
VFGDWLARLRAAAYAEDKVGTVTPFTNCGTIASYLPDESPPLTPERACVYHQLAASTHAGVSVDIPVGVGFCLYVRRDCLDAVGLFDEAVFGKGYGEESDFCIRARKTGWRHRFAADVFVYHAGGRSFSSRRLALFDRSQRLLNLRHPGYDATVRRFLAADPLAPLRRTLDERRLKSMDGRFVLLLTLAIPGGGVDRYVGERCRRIRSEGLLPLVLRPAAMGDATRCALWTDALAAHDLRYAVPDEIARLREVLGALAIERVEIQHFLHLDPRVVDMARSIGAPYDVYVHDYAWICPRVTLIGGEGRYCGEPDLAACEACVMENGSNLDERITVAALRRRSTGWLQDARDVFAPTSDTASRLRRYFSRTIEVRPHGPPLAAVAAAMREAVDGTIRVALLGGIGEHKGHRLLLACARDAAARRLPLEYVVIGYTEDDKPLLETGKVFVTGRYSEAEAPHLLRREQPHIAFLASVWPETWSYVLDHAVSAGLPVVAFDLGAIAERLRESGLGTLLPLDSRAGDINDVFLQLSGRAAAIRPNAASALEAPPAARQGAPPPVEFHPPDLSPFRPRTDHYEPKINETMKTANATESASADDALSASLQLLPLPVGLYLFSVKAAVPSATPAMGNITLPAVHVGLGPGVDPRRVEFVAGPATSGPWLFAQGDLLVVKITGSGVAPLVLTSVRAPGGETLSIKIERLEGRNEAATSAPAASVEPEAAKPAASRDRAEEKPRKPTVVARPDELGLPVQIKAHVRARGDMTFSDTPWAGRVGAGMWMESFSVLPLDRFSAADIEYKGLTASGFETPWLSDDAMCGTKGMAIPLIGFAVRLKPSPDTAAYDCEYSGYFQSGTTSGPFRNGAPCRSTVANDPLEGIQIRIVKRKARATGTAGPQAGHGDELASAVGVGEPDLGSYRTLHADDVVHTTSATKSAAGGRPARTSGKAAAKLNSKGKSAGNGNANGGGAGGTMKSAKAGSSSRPAADQRSPRPRSTRPQR